MCISCGLGCGGGGVKKGKDDEEGRRWGRRWRGAESIEYKLNKKIIYLFIFIIIIDLRIQHPGRN